MRTNDTRRCIHLLRSDARTRCDRCRAIDDTFRDLALAFGVGLVIWSMIAVVINHVAP